jgi:rare lipoprotein A
VKPWGGPPARAARPILALGLLLFGCVPPAPKPDPHYFLGQPHQTGGIWFYPRESFDLDETGLAAIARNDTPRLTADGELFDQSALAAAHATIQLPAIARLTNLENGRQVAVRLNDRDSGDPRRLVEITRRTALLLAIAPDSVARVRLQVLPNESHAAADELPGAPSLAIEAAPRGQVQVAELAPPPGARLATGRAVPVTAAIQPARPVSEAPPMRLPETITQTAPQPGQLLVRLDTFDQYQYAAVQRAKMAAAGARIVTTVQNRRHRFRVDIGPLPDIARAEAVLEQALASGIPDARIVVD